MSREQQRRDHDAREAEVESSDVTAREADATLAADVDAILDEIDEVLERNAEEFVKGFVQKGGQ